MEFEVGDAVFLKIRGYRQKSLAKRRNEKLSAKYFGPYTMEQRIGQVAYRLALPPEAVIRPVLHVSQLKKAIGSNFAVQQIPSPTNRGDGVEVRA